MAQAQEDEDKQYDPTPRKLEEARRKGDIARSQDINVAVSYGGFLLAWLGLGVWLVDGAGATMRGLLDRSDELGVTFLADGSSSSVGRLISDILQYVAPLVLIPAVGVLAALISMRGVVFAPQKIRPKLSRISPIENAKNKFGRSGLFEFAKSAAKLCVFSTLLALYLSFRLDDFIGALYLQPFGVGHRLGELVADFFFIVLAIASVIAAIDFTWQFSEHRRRNRMSRKELMDETKQTEGDPALKQARRQRGYEIAMNRMLDDVPSADVVVVNPQHFSVALRWSRSSASAPVCVAKGVDHVAARIREAAIAAGVPIHRDPPTARMLYQNVEVGAEIRPQDYRAVAIAIRFAEEMRKKRRWMTAAK